MKTVTGVATQGDPSSDKWVKTYLISYSYDSSSWRNYKLEQKDVPGKVFIECFLVYSIVQYEATAEATAEAPTILLIGEYTSKQ